MTHSFNKKQQLSVDKINEFISQNVEKKFYLFGYAGTGKTFLISNVTMQLIADNKMDHIFICAPTHKALNVIESYFRSNFDPIKQKELMTKISFMTIHKLLEFKPIIANEDGSKIFKSTKESKFLKQMDNKLIIMDECSMISEDMVTQLDKYINCYPLKIIYLGDSAQLPPVREHQSLIFAKIPKKYNYHIVLDEIMRTNSPDIKDVATIIRQWNREDSLVQALLPIHNRKSPVKTFKLYHKKGDHLQTTWFKNFISKLNANNIPIILTWKNATSDMYNRLIRQYVHKSLDLNNFMVGDYALFNNFYTSPEDCTSFYTSDMIKIIDINTASRRLLKWSKLIIEKPKTVIDKGFNTMMKKICKLNTKVTIDIFTVERIHSDMHPIINNKSHVVKTIHRDDLERYQEILKTIQEYIENFFKKYKSTSYVSRLWNIYHKTLINPYAELSFGYSITTHKAQGSTFDTVFVDVDDLAENPDIEEMQKCLYTGATRASNELGFLLT